MRDAPRRLARWRGGLLPFEAALSSLAPWVDLAVRFWLAKLFLTGAAVRLATHVAPTMAADHSWATAVNGLVATPFGFVVQTLCPLLLLAGVLTRAAGLLLLIQLVALGNGGDGALRLEWAALLGWLVVLGPGSLSLDAVLSRGFDTSAVPGAGRIARGADWLTKRLGPPYRLGLRLWIATAPLAAALGALDAGLVAPRSDYAAFAALPGMSAMLPSTVLALLGGMLALGLGTRVAALVLVAAVPLATIGMVLDDRLYWVLLLGTIAVHGAGPYALDRLVAQWLDRPGSDKPAAEAQQPHVVVVGGGFGGAAVVRGLRNASCRITLVDRRNHQLFQPLLYQVATAGLSPADIAAPIRGLFRAQPNVRVLLGEVIGVDPDRGQVLLDGGALRYDHLVLCTGSQHSYFGRDDWAPHAPGLKQIEDATEVRRRLLTGFERAEAASDPAAAAAWLTFVIVGGGPTGVELAGAIAELARHGLDGDFRGIDPATARIILVQSGPRLLPTFPETLSAEALAALAALGVEIRLGARVDGVDAEGVGVSGERIAARTVLWAAGVQASPAGRWLGAPVDRAGRVLVGPDLRVGDFAAIFAVGDTAASAGWAGQPVPGLAPAAKQGGAYVAKVIARRLRGLPAPKPFRYRHLGSLATIGRRSAVAEFGPVRLRGALAWWLWGAVHVAFLVGGRNRLGVLLQWAWAYFTYRRGTRLITGSRSLS